MFPFIWNPIKIPAWGYFWCGIESIFMTAYYVTLSRAYEIGDLSLVYPVSRGTAPIFTLCFLAWVLRMESVTAPGVAGILLIIVGVWCMNLQSLRPRHWLKGAGDRKLAPGAMIGILSGIFIAGYFIAAKFGRHYMDALQFNMLNSIFTGFNLLLWCAFFHSMRDARALIRRFTVEIVIASVLMFASYYLALYAMQLGNVSYIVPLRNFSVIISAILGIVLLKEKQGAVKLFGSSLIFLGMLGIALAGGG